MNHSAMKVFAHYQDLPLGMIAPSTGGRMQEIEANLIRFVVNIPDSITLEEVRREYVSQFLARQQGIVSPLIGTSDRMAFEEDWPREVNDVFQSGDGERWLWPLSK